MDQGDVASHWASGGAPHGALVTPLVMQPAHLALTIRLLYQVSAAGSTCMVAKVLLRACVQ